jgi:HSP20 family molecular chaperone IbpA
MTTISIHSSTKILSSTAQWWSVERSRILQQTQRSNHSDRSKLFFLISSRFLSINFRLDLHEDKENNLVIATFELPGMKKENVSIDVRQEQLTVSGEVSVSSETKEGDYTVRERRSGKFSRSVKLPKGVKPEDINAKMENGLLSVTFPATQSENAPSRITIN